MKFKFLLPAMLFLFACSGSDNDPIDTPDEPTIDWVQVADKSTAALISSFWNTGEKYFNYSSSGNTQFHYWPQAHALDVLTDAYLRTKDSKYLTYFDQWLEGVKRKNGNTFRNEYYDDMEWNALAILRVYSATKDAKFKDAALQIWGYIKEGWTDNEAGGGIRWREVGTGGAWSKNACSNGPACILAARIYQEFGDDKDREWAMKIYNWEKSTLFTNNGMVLDNIDNQGNISSWVFTYNQGTFVGSAVELHRITNEKAYLNDAVKAADYTISSLVSNSILKSEGTGDGGLFKGIFVRYFAQLIQQERLDAGDKRRYLQFLQLNAETLWNKGTNQSICLFGPDWSVSPGSSSGLTENTSGCMLTEAAALLL